MAKARLKPEELLAQGRPSVATLPGGAPASPFLDPNVAQAKPQGSELYNLGTVQQAAASTRDANMFNPSYLQEPQNYPTGAEGGIPQPQGANPLLYPTTAETQPKLKARLKPNEALALAEVSRPRRKSPDEIRDELAVGMYDPSQTPLPQDLWSEATQRRSQMIREGRLPMEFGEIDSLADGLVWTKDAAYGVGSYILGTLGDAAASLAADPVGAVRQLPATIGSATQRTATELGLQTYQDTFNLTHEPKYRVKETGEFVAVNKTGLPLFMPAASGGNNVISADGIIDLRTPEQGIRAFAEQGKTLVPVTEQDIKDYRYGQYADRMAMGAQSLEAQNFRAPSNLSQQVLAAMPGGMPLAALLAATDPGGTVGPNQAQAEIAVLAAQSAIPAGAASRSWGISRRVAGGLSKVAGAAESTAGFFPNVDTALRAKFVKTVTSGTSLDAGAQRTALQAAIDGSKTLGIASGAYAAATGLSSIEGVPGELKQAAWTAANLYSGYKGGMFVARQLRSASGFAKTVLKEVADPAQGLDVGARMRVAANPDVPDFVRSVLRSPSSFRAVESTPARLAKNQALSPAARAVFSKLSDYRFVQAARLAKDTAAGAPKGMVANVPFAAGAFASDDPERGGQMLAAGGSFGALGGAAGRFTGAKQRSAERAEGDIARLLVDIQAGNELSGGLGGDIMRNRIRPGTQFQDGPGGFVINPDREVSSFLTEVEMAGGDVSAFVRGKSLDELSQWAAYQGFFRDKVDLVPLNATDFKLNAEANGQNGAGAYFLQPSEGRRARIFVNAESRRNGLAPHEYGHAVLRGGALSPDQIDAVHAEVNSRYAPDALRNMAGEYAATMVRAENTKQGIDIEPSPAAIAAKIKDLSQNSMIKGSADGLDWLREEIFAEEFRNANIDMNRARRNIPLGANPVSFFENLLGAQSRALNMAGIDIDPQTGKPMGRDQIFKENRVAAGDPVVMKNYGDYVKQWKRWINDPTHEADPGALLSKTGNPQDTANSPNVTWKDYGRGRMETEFAVKNPDGSVTLKNWNKDIKPTVKARQQAVREMSNRSREVAAADDQTFGMRRRRDGRLETSGRRLPDSFFFIPQYKPFHDILRKINAADDAGETLQVRFFAKGKSKDVFKDGVKNTSAVNREAQHGNFVAKKDGTLMWGWLDMTQFRNRAMKAIADKNPALAQYDWNLKAIMDDLPVHLTDQRRGKGGAFSVGSERANILNGLIGIGDGPLVGAFGKGTAYKTIHLDSIDAVVPTGKAGGEFDVYRANRNAMPDDPKPPVDMETDINNNRMPSALPQSGMAMPDGPVRGERADIPINPRARQAAFISDRGEVRATGRATHFETNEDLGPDFLAIGAGHLGEDGFFRFGSQSMDEAMGDSPADSSAAAARYNQSVYDQGRRPSSMLEEPPGLEQPGARGQAMPDAEARSAAVETLDQLKRSQFIPTKVAAEVIGGFPEYLRPVAQFITDQRQKLASGQITRRDVMKAYAITVASQGSGARAVEVIANNVAKDGVRFRPSKDFTTVDKKGRAAIRPEEAAAYWLGTDAGQKALNNFESGRYSPDDWKELVAIRKAYGDDRFNNLGVLRSDNIGVIDKVLADINASRADTGKVMDAVQQLRGIKTGKKGFISHLLGIGDVPTIDAVEINFWLTGKASIGKLNSSRATLARNVKKSIGDDRVGSEMFRRIDKRINLLRNEVPGASEIAPEAWSHVMHHWLWDKSKGIETTHEGMYRAQAQFMPDVVVKDEGGTVWKEVQNAPIVSLKDFEGRPVFAAFADLTSAGKIYRGIDSSEIAVPVETHGGPEWPLIQDEVVGKETDVWTNQGAGVSAMKARRANEGAIMLVAAMDKNAHVSNTETATAVIATNAAYARDGRITPENLAALDNSIRKEIEDFPGIESPSIMEYVNKLPFQGAKSRARIAEILESKKSQDLGAPNVQRILDEMRSDQYDGLRIGDIVLAIELTPGAPVVKLGEQGTMVHPSYQYAVRGRVIGRFARPINIASVFDDFYAKRRAEGKPELGDRRAFDLAKPVQVITPAIAARIPGTPYNSFRSPRHAQVINMAKDDRWRSSEQTVKAGGVSPAAFIDALNASPAKLALDRYTLKGLQEKLETGAMSIYQLGDAQVFFGIKQGDPASSYGQDPAAFGFGPNEKTLSLVLNNERKTGGMADAIVMKSLQLGVTALDCFAVKSPDYPAGMLPKLYASYGFEKTGTIPFDPQYYSKTELADLKKYWKSIGWDESLGLPEIVLMKWKGNDELRTKSLREIVDQSRSGVRGRLGQAVADARDSRKPLTRAVRGRKRRSGQGDSGASARSEEDAGRGVRLSRGFLGAYDELLSMSPDELRNLGIK